MVPQGYESIMAGRHGNRDPDSKIKGLWEHAANSKPRESELKMERGFKLSEPAPRGTLPRARLPITSPNSTANWGPSVTLLVLPGAFLIQNNCD